MKLGSGQLSIPLYLRIFLTFKKAAYEYGETNDYYNVIKTFYLLIQRILYFLKNIQHIIYNDAEIIFKMSFLFQFYYCTTYVIEIYQKQMCNKVSKCI